MYSRQSSPIHLQESPSCQPNNLSVSSSKDKICYVRLSDVILNDLKGGSMRLPLPVCDIYQAAFAIVDGTEIIVVASNLGVQLWSKDGDQLLYFYSITSLIDRDIENHYFKGIGSSHNFLAVGTSFGSVMVLSTASGTGAKDEVSYYVLENLPTSATPISCLSLSTTLLATGNDNGDIFLHNPKDGFVHIHQFQGKGSPVTSICQDDDTIYAGYFSGHIRIFRPLIHELAVEIAADIRPISGLIFNPGLNSFASCSEDQYIHMWSAPDFSTNPISGLSLLFSEKIDNRICTGIGFLGDNKLCVDFYDDESLVVFQKV